MVNKSQDRPFRASISLMRETAFPEGGLIAHTYDPGGPLVASLVDLQEYCDRLREAIAACGAI